MSCSGSFIFYYSNIWNSNSFLLLLIKENSDCFWYDKSRTLTFPSSTEYFHRSIRKLQVCYRSVWQRRKWDAYTGRDQHFLGRILRKHRLCIGPSLCSNIHVGNFHLRRKQRTISDLHHFCKSGSASMWTSEFELLRWNALTSFF